MRLGLQKSINMKTLNKNLKNDYDELKSLVICLLAIERCVVFDSMVEHCVKRNQVLDLLEKHVLVDCEEKKIAIKEAVEQCLKSAA